MANVFSTGTCVNKSGKLARRSSLSNRMFLVDWWSRWSSTFKSLLRFDLRKQVYSRLKPRIFSVLVVCILFNYFTYIFLISYLAPLFLFTKYCSVVCKNLFLYLSFLLAWYSTITLEYEIKGLYKRIYKG